MVTLQSAGDRRKIMDKKRELKNSRNFKDIFIENDLSKNQRMLNMNLPKILQADLNHPWFSEWTLLVYTYEQQIFIDEIQVYSRRHIQLSSTRDGSKIYFQTKIHTIIAGGTK